MVFLEVEIADLGSSASYSMDVLVNLSGTQLSEPRLMDVES